MGTVRRSSLLLLAAIAAQACTPTCDQVCAKVISCGTVDALNQYECEETCDRQQVGYEVDKDKTLQRAFAEHRQCIGAATCDEIEAGLCYDERLFEF